MFDMLSENGGTRGKKLTCGITWKRNWLDWNFGMEKVLKIFVM